jgi:hypothetical protein
MQKDEVVVKFKALAWNLPGGTEKKNAKNLSRINGPQTQN